MYKICGYVAKYKYDPNGNVKFKKGCFNKYNSDRSVPIVNDIQLPIYIIGRAELEVKDDGLYATCEINSDVMKKPYGFIFYGSKTRSNVDGDEYIVEQTCVDTIAFDYEEGNDVSTIDVFERI